MMNDERKENIHNVPRRGVMNDAASPLPSDISLMGSGDRDDFVSCDSR